MAHRMFNVLFVCTGNSARSVMAECAMNRWGLGKFRGYSAGSTPKGQIHPMAIDVLRRLNYNTDNLRSKDWTEFAEGAGGPPLDFVFTLVRPGGRRGLPGVARPADDRALGRRGSGRLRRPRGQGAQAVPRRVRHAREPHQDFRSLPISSLDRLSLQGRLQEIGRHARRRRGPGRSLSRA